MAAYSQAANVTEENVKLLQGILEVERHTAQELLKLNNNDVNAAVNQYFNNPGGSVQDTNGNQSWDAASWGADRYGQQNTSSSNIPSFNIEYAPGVEQYPHSVPNSGAPSRPPSRTSHRSAGTTAAERGDSPVRQSVEQEQEMGVLRGNSPAVFGPANRDVYEEDKWAMVPISTITELVPDAQPGKRKREEGGPTILKPLPSEDYLPAMLTIAHSIPTFRNFLLAPQIEASNYLVGTDWWKGGEPSSPMHESSIGIPEDLELIYEVQRLMAFLDGTDRAYGSVKRLARLSAVEHASMEGDSVNEEMGPMHRFLLSWARAYENQTHENLTGKLRTKVVIGSEEQDFFKLDAHVPVGDEDQPLYDVLDNAFIGDDANHALALISIPSEVLILEMFNNSNGTTGLRCKLPRILYIDRYLEENRNVMEELIKETRERSSQLRAIEREIETRKWYKLKNVRPGEKVETLKLLETSMQAFQPSDEGGVESSPHASRNATALEQLREIYSKIESQLRELEEQKTKIRETLASTQARFRPPFDRESPNIDAKSKQNDSPVEPSQEQEDIVKSGETMDVDKAHEPPETMDFTHSYQQHPYRFVGASTKRGVYYLQQRDLLTNELCWWRIHYLIANDGEVDILRERVANVDFVLDRIECESSHALLMYAKDTAFEESPLPLSPALYNFVKDDNVKFNEELAREMGFGEQDFGPVEPLGGWAEEQSFAPLPDDEWTNTGQDHEDAIPDEPPPSYTEIEQITVPLERTGGVSGQGITVEVKGQSEALADGAEAPDTVSSGTLTPNTEVDSEEEDEVVPAVDPSKLVKDPDAEMQDIRDTYQGRGNQ
ncbi:uncharacterized protein EI97DRAFT_475749 [Westerdykella ornata]|uniref:Ubiquitin interaction motif protein n=1 Tax=Westerdykella ornata TaxID=318751 RepID=A0A6A6JF16_WESOR|nr:uncharacterized protein EI97DRAFT_475749 [Westerdykella ornata]KAF2275210.1 hypothetical protein EI97DRAFT_475749 [Westerdykella ornata]